MGKKSVEGKGLRSHANGNPSIDISSLPILSFFTGAGFLDLGFLQAGFTNIIWRNEYDHNFVRGFEYAMKAHTGVEHRVSSTTSIDAISSKKILDEAFQKTGRPKVFGIIGGTPCPDFAIGGKNRGSEGTYGKLSEVYVTHIIKLRPTFFLLENVAGLSRTAKHKSFLSKLVSQLSKYYSVDHQVLNALDYGAPQFRERVFVIGFRKDWLKQEFDAKIADTDNGWFPWVSASFPKAKTTYRWTHPTPFGENPEKPSDIPDRLMVGTHICNQQQVSSLPNGTEAFNPKSDKFVTIREGDSSGKSFKRLHRWRYSPAAAYGNNEVHLHPTEARRLTVREVLRIQTVPDTYALPVDLSLTHKFKMIGNGVPVVLADAVANSVKNMLTDGPVAKDFELT